ncbi:MAG: hypothetical protein CM1200mP29_03530 [Verrucomicrobiota bacterium]|nr:MAG: hypothetical protein CM1200mP29_03530 [Verrucomicrobiota bacterium]
MTRRRIEPNASSSWPRGDESGNGRLSRTIVNRLWARFLGRGLVEPVDEMETVVDTDLLTCWEAIYRQRIQSQVHHGTNHDVAAYPLPAVKVPSRRKRITFFGGHWFAYERRTVCRCHRDNHRNWKPSPAKKIKFDGANLPA